MKIKSIFKDCWRRLLKHWTFQVALVVKNSPANARDIRNAGSIPGSGRSPRGGHGNPLQYCSWRIVRTEEPGRLQSIALQKVRYY